MRAGGPGARKAELLWFAIPRRGPPYLSQLGLKPAQPAAILHDVRSGHLLIPVFWQSMII
jgi:hypothetical protein